MFFHHLIYFLSAIVRAVKFSMKIADDTLTNNVLYADYLAAKNIGDKVGQEDRLHQQSDIKLSFRICGCLSLYRHSSSC